MESSARSWNGTGRDWIRSFPKLPSEELSELLGAADDDTRLLVLRASMIPDASAPLRELVERFGKSRRTRPGRRLSETRRRCCLRSGCVQPSVRAR